MMKRKAIWLFLLTQFFFGCLTLSGMKDFQKMNKFAPVAESYAQAIKWSDFETAGFFAKHMNSSLDYDKLKWIKVTSYEVKEIIHKKDELTVTQAVELKFFSKTMPTEKTLRYQETWQYDEADRSWILIDGFPKFN